ncbi:HNH endonuclease [Marinoscillum sp. MHG1-6]|uniref:HNH endonuclease n=1 Tax=Marinoscillum sp. MHG1-6 TaxID=2959627 RepID=UPI0021570CE6|nr:HNH endonuclease [Marinoscillum sp. MHG1-6]
MNSVLVLNQDFSPISICSVERAFLLIYLDKAELLTENPDLSLRTINQSYPFPSVIKIKRYIHIPYQGVVLTRHNIFRRDNHECQYCGTNHNLTLDHLIPRSKGGKSTWSNLVTACKHCNSKKGDFSPEEMGMTLRQKPSRPTYLTFIKQAFKDLREDWKPFLERKSA